MMNFRGFSLCVERTEKISVKMAKEIGSAISYHINHDIDSFKWVRFIGTKYATVFDN